MGGTMFRRVVAKNQFLTFYLLAFAIASAVVVWRHFYGLQWAEEHGATFEYTKILLDGIGVFYGGPVYANIISIGWVAWTREPIFFGVFLFAGSPTIAAIIVVWIASGASGLKSLFGRFKLWSSRAFREDALGAYALITAVFLGYAIINLLVIDAHLGPEEVERRAGWWGLPLYLFPITFLIGGFIDEGATCEELGWRGFALPRLLEWLNSPLGVSILLGALWWFWHFPREIPDLVRGVEWPTWAYWQAIFLLLVIAMSIVMTFFYYRTGGSVIPAFLIHGWGNFSTKAVGSPIDLSGIGDRNALLILAAIVLVATYGPSLGKGRYSELIARDKPD